MDSLRQSPTALSPFFVPPNATPAQRLEAMQLPVLPQETAETQATNVWDAMAGAGRGAGQAVNASRAALGSQTAVASAAANLGRASNVAGYAGSAADAAGLRGGSLLPQAGRVLGRASTATTVVATGLEDGSRVANALNNPNLTPAQRNQEVGGASGHFMGTVYGTLQGAATGARLGLAACGSYGPVCAIAGGLIGGAVGGERMGAAGEAMGSAAGRPIDLRNYDPVYLTPLPTA